MTPEESKRLADTATLLGCKTSEALRMGLESVNVAAEELKCQTSLK